MKYVKPLSLAAAAAMALMAFLGAGSASATVLCKTPLTSGCAANGWAYPIGTTIDLSLEGTATTETTGGTVLDTCSAGTIEGNTSNVGGDFETVLVSISELTSGTPTSPCTKTTDTLTTGLLEIHWISGTDNGTVTGKNTKITKNSIFGSCTYGSSAAGTHLGTLTGGNPATLHLEAVVPLIEGGGLCPADARWTGSYKVTEPDPLYVATN